MSSADLADLWVHTVTVKAYQGVTGSGTKLLADPVERAMFVEGKRRLVRDSDGTQVISETTAYGDVGFAGDFPPQSEVTLPDGTTSTVITANVNDSAGLDLPDHVAVFLQ